MDLLFAGGISRRWLAAGGVALFAGGAAAAYAIARPPPPASGTAPSQPHLSRQAVFDANAAGYDAHVDSHEWLAGIASLRRSLIGSLAGSVLEVGAGTGRNVDAYSGAAVKRVVLMDFAPSALAVARGKVVARAAREVRMPRFELVCGDAEALPYPPASFDAAVDTFGLCSYQRPERVLAELARVVKPGGRVVLLEHGRSTWAPVQALLERTAAGHVARHGCDWSRDIDALIAAAAAAAPGGEHALRVVSAERRHAGTTYAVTCEVVLLPPAATTIAGPSSGAAAAERPLA